LIAHLIYYQHLRHVALGTKLVICNNSNMIINHVLNSLWTKAIARCQVCQHWTYILTQDFFSHYLFIIFFIRPALLVIVFLGGRRGGRGGGGRGGRRRSGIGGSRGRGGARRGGRHCIQSMLFVFGGCDISMLVVVVMMMMFSMVVVRMLLLGRGGGDGGGGCTNDCFGLFCLILSICLT